MNLIFENTKLATTVLVGKLLKKELLKILCFLVSKQFIYK